MSSFILAPAWLPAFAGAFAGMTRNVESVGASRHGPGATVLLYALRVTNHASVFEAVVFDGSIRFLGVQPVHEQALFLLLLNLADDGWFGALEILLAWNVAAD